MSGCGQWEMGGSLCGRVITTPSFSIHLYLVRIRSPPRYDQLIVVLNVENFSDNRSGIVRLSYGAEPYKGDKGNNLPPGHPMAKPDACPPACYDEVMMACWNSDPERRSTSRILASDVNRLPFFLCEFPSLQDPPLYEFPWGIRTGKRVISTS